MPPFKRARRASLSAIAGSMIIAVGGGPLSDAPLFALATAGPSPGTDAKASVTESSTSTAGAPTGGTGPSEAGAAVQEATSSQSPAGPASTSTTTPTSTTPASTPTPTPAPIPTTTSQTTSTATSPTTTPPPSSAPASVPAAPAAPSPEAPIVVRQRPQEITGGEKVEPKISHTHGQPSTGGAEGSTGATGSKGAATRAGAPAPAGSIPADNSVAPPPQLAAGEAGALAAELASSAASVQALSFYRIPLFLLPIYQSAAVQYGVPWQILAAINEIETNYGTDLSVSTAGAVGWMQFMPATWSSYGVDAFKAGYADPYNPVDAIYAAARYLRAAGAAQNLRGAILAYNHSDEYADSVLLRAKLISTYPQSVIQTLTGLVDDRPPATGRALIVEPLRVPTASAAASLAKASQTPGSQAPPAPATAAAIATGSSAAASAPKLIDLLSAPHAAVVAVQDGRIVKLGVSRKLGRYVILRDLYGDEFTYAGLGSIASSYRLPSASSTPLQTPATIGSDSHDPAPSKPASAGRQLPQTLAATTPSPASEADEALQSSAFESTPAGMGKVRLFAHPHNPDAIAAAHSASLQARAQKQSEGASGLQPLRSGSVVAEGTVLGHVNLPPRAKDGHLQFAIRPAGDPTSIDPAPILENWIELKSALHPRGAKSAQSLLGATASEAFLISKARLQSEILSDPGVRLSACSKTALASGQIDKRVLALIAFLSRSGLSPTISALSCSGGRYDSSGYVPADHSGDAIAITAINGIPIEKHQGQGSISDTAIRTLLTVPARFAPHQIVSLMRYPGDPSTIARSDHGSYIELVFEVAKPSPRTSATKAKAAHSAPTGQSAPSPLSVSGELSAAQWEALITRVGALPVPTVSTKPSASAVPDALGG